MDKSQVKPRPEKAAKDAVGDGAATKPLTAKQEAFCSAYVETGNASEAYRRAYGADHFKDESLRVSGSRLLAAANVTLRVKELQKAAADVAILKSADVLREIAKLAFSDPRGIMHEDGRIKLPHELDALTAASISSFEVDEKGGIKYKFWDKNSALEKAAKHLGLYEKDNEQKTNPILDLIKQIGNSSVPIVQKDV